MTRRKKEGPFLFFLSFPSARSATQTKNIFIDSVSRLMTVSLLFPCVLRFVDVTSNYLPRKPSIYIYFSFPLMKHLLNFV